MNEKEAYFKKSIERGAPNRCPLLHRCRRRSNTIALFNDLDVGGGIELAELEEPYVSIRGEAPYAIRGASNWLYGALCPEVPLFEPTVSITQFVGLPATKGQYDRYANPSFQVLESGHFSECAEYSDFRGLTDNQPIGTILQNTSKGEKTGFWVAHWKWLVGTFIALVRLVLQYVR